MTGESCSTEPSGLPNENCMYYANLDSNVTSSLMALPYLSSNNHFCDDDPGKYIEWFDIHGIITFVRAFYDHLLASKLVDDHQSSNQLCIIDYRPFDILANIMFV